MDMANYMDIARAEGYEVQFTGIGTAYVVFGKIMLTEVMEIEQAKAELALIGLAIVNDDVRRMIRKR